MFLIGSIIGIIAIIVAIFLFLKPKQSQIDDSVFLENTKVGDITAPIIKHIKWGEISVEYPRGNIQKFKDCIITPNRVEEWSWKKDGTRHKPGITVAAIKGLLDECDIIVLSKGFKEILQVSPKALQFIKKQTKKSFTIKQTLEAVRAYNEYTLENKLRIGALIHSTC